MLDLGLRVTRLGTRSVTYEVGGLGLAPNDDRQPKQENHPPDTVDLVAVGGHIRVFVESASCRATPIMAMLKSNLVKLMTDAVALTAQAVMCSTPTCNITHQSMHN